MTRRFEFVGGNSAKFWEISRAGKEVTVRYGRLGTDGQELPKQFTDQATAIAYTENLVAQKLAKGYVECVAA